MAFVCPTTMAETASVGDGHCVALVRSTCNMPAGFNTPRWRAGAKVRGNTSILPGTAIATFVDGQYPASDKHAAIYLRQDTGGIWVKQQYQKGVKPFIVHEAYLPFGGNGSHRRTADGDNYYVIEE